MANDVAKMILEQMGGGMAMKMIGGYDLIADPAALSFKFKAKAKEGLNFCKVTLTPMDVYEVEFGRIRRDHAAMTCQYTKVHQFDDVYCDMLQDIFERTTGLYLSIGVRMRPCMD